MMERSARHDDLKTWQRLDPGIDYSCHMSPCIEAIFPHLQKEIRMAWELNNTKYQNGL